MNACHPSRNGSKHETQTSACLRDSELSYRGLFDAAQDGILILDADSGCVCDVNPFLVNLLGFSWREMIGKTVGELSPFKDTVANKGILEQLQNEEYVRYEDLPLETRDGRPIAVEFVCSVFEVAGKKLIQCNIRDITERKLAEEALKRLAGIIEASDDAIIGKDLSGIITSWNRGAKNIFGYTAEEVVGTSIMRLIPADRTNEEQHILQKIKLGESVEHLETVRQTKDGRMVNVLITASPIKDAMGKVTGVSKVAHDITDRKRAENVLRESERRYRSLYNSIDEGFCVVEMIFDKNATPIDYRFLEINPAFEKQSGLRDALGKRMRQLVPDHDRFWFDTYGKVALTGESIRFQNEAKSMNRWFDGYAFRLGDPAKLHVAVLFTDITERKAEEEKHSHLNIWLEQRVYERTAELKSAVEELEAFSYSVSHDLRAPLRHITGFVELIQKDAGPSLSKKNLDYLAKVSHSAKRMGNLIDDLLDFAHIGRAAMQMTDVNLYELVQETLNEFLPETAGRKIAWEIQPLPIVRADRALLQMVMVNLIANAVKFTSRREEASIEIGRLEIDEWRVTGSGENGSTSRDTSQASLAVPASTAAGHAPQATFFIRDNGAGFDPRYVGKLFGVFQRLHSAAEFEGTGIGLANVQRIIHRHGGRVWAEGAVNKGATFYFSIPKRTTEGDHGP